MEAEYWYDSQAAEARSRRAPMGRDLFEFLEEFGRAHDLGSRSLALLQVSIGTAADSKRPDTVRLMSISEAQQFVGRNCWVSWTDRSGQKHDKVLRVEDLQYVPLYGAYIIGDTDDVDLEAISRIQSVE